MSSWSFVTSCPVSSDLEGFVVDTGLLHWQALAPAGLLRSDWAPDYDANIEQRYRCPFTFGASYAINFVTGQCAQLLGNVVPGLVADHDGSPFSAYDRDLDSHNVNCAAQYPNSPWWYTSCWSGSMDGDGEYTSAGHQNGAYWRGSAAGWGGAGGVGAGNGWIYVR